MPVPLPLPGAVSWKPRYARWPLHRELTASLARAPAPALARAVRQLYVRKREYCSRILGSELAVAVMRTLMDDTA